MRHSQIVLTAIFAALSGICAQAIGAVTLNDLVPTLTPIACKARDVVSSHPTLAAFEIEYTIRQAISEAKSVFKQPTDSAVASQKLAPLEATLGTLREIPSIDLHQLLGAIAGIEGRPDDQQYHRAYSVALMLCLSRTGDGLAPDSAFKIVMISEEYDWFLFNQSRLTRDSRYSKDINGRKYDIWKVKLKDGNESVLYFDAQQMADSLQRVLGARLSKNQAASK